MTVFSSWQSLSAGVRRRSWQSGARYLLNTLLQNARVRRIWQPRRKVVVLVVCTMPSMKLCSDCRWCRGGALTPRHVVSTLNGIQRRWAIKAGLSTLVPLWGLTPRNIADLGPCRIGLPWLAAPLSPCVCSLPCFRLAEIGCWKGLGLLPAGFARLRAADEFIHADVPMRRCVN